MIFTIKANPDELSSIPQEEIDELEELFTSLIEADFKGRHFLILPRDLCEWATSNLELSGRHRSHLARISNQFSDRGDMLNKAKSQVRILVGAQPISFEPKGGVYSVGHLKFISREFAATKTAFVVENGQNDAGLYRHLLNEVLMQSDVPGFTFDTVHSGGSSLPEVLKAQVDGGRIAICIADTDKYAPCDKMCGTAKKADKYFVKCNITKDADTESFIGAAFTTLGRELENCIPFAVVREMHHYAGHSSFDLLDTIVIEKNPISLDDSFWHFFDLKEGMDGAKIKEKLDGELISQQVIAWLMEKLQKTEEELFALNIEGFGPKFVSNFLSCNESKSRFHRFSRSEYWRSIYLEYFERILWFLVAPQPSRT